MFHIDVLMKIHFLPWSCDIFLYGFVTMIYALKQSGIGRK